MNALHENGVKIPVGSYQQMPENCSTKIWDGNGGLQSPRRLQRKSWIFTSANDADFFIGFAIVDAGLLGKAFVYIFDKKNKKCIENHINIPLGFSADFDPSFQGSWKLGEYQVHYNENQLFCEVNTKQIKYRLSIEVDLKGISFMCPAGDRPFHFTYKNLHLKANAYVEFNGKQYKEREMVACIDFSKGYPPRHTFWNWLSFTGETESGKQIGLNLVDQFNGNIENVLWLDNEVIPVSKALFIYENPMEAGMVTINTVDGIIEISMTAEGKRGEHMNFILMKSKFTQVFGQISGKIRWKNQLLEIKGYGVIEEHEALW